MAVDDGEWQGKRWPDHCGFLYPAGYLWASHLATGPAYLYFRCLAATIGLTLVWYDEFWRGCVPPDGGRRAFLGFYGTGHWPSDYNYFGTGGAVFWLLSWMGRR